MAEVTPQLSDEEMAELTAFADGSLPPEDRARVEARLAASPALRALVERQRQAVGAIRTMADEPVPTSLRERVEADLRPTGAGHRRSGVFRWRPALAASGAFVAVAVAVVIALSGGATEPTVADAAQLGTTQPTGPPPRPASAGTRRLNASIDGVAFPDLRSAYGWRATGMRRGRIDGHDALVVYYSRRDRRIAYVVVAGEALGGDSGYGRATARGVEFRTFSVEGRPAVTWRRNGHTCVLMGTASRSELLALASWVPRRAQY
jgi:anti-sigma factor RsiW